MLGKHHSVTHGANPSALGACGARAGGGPSLPHLRAGLPGNTALPDSPCAVDEVYDERKPFALGGTAYNAGAANEAEAQKGLSTFALRGN